MRIVRDHDDYADDPRLTDVGRDRLAPIARALAADPFYRAHLEVWALTPACPCGEPACLTSECLETIDAS
jgi:hypothetical protein